MNRNKTGVRYLNVQYNVNPGKRLFACHLTFGLNLNRLPYIEMLKDNEEFINLVEREFRVEEWAIDDDFFYEPHVVTEVVAFADCAPEDEFDEVLGKKIALTRAQSGAFDTAAYIYERIQDIFLKAANEIDIRLENSIESIDKCNKHVDTLIERAYGKDSE
jgi:hypothetical protein